MSILLFEVRFSAKGKMILCLMVIIKIPIDYPVDSCQYCLYRGELTEPKDQIPSRYHLNEKKGKNLMQ